MSANVVEQVLWDINARADVRARYRIEPDAVLAGYALEAAECAQILALDVRALADRGVSQMLLMMVFQTLQGPPPVSMPDYLRRMNQPAALA